MTDDKDDEIAKDSEVKFFIVERTHIDASRPLPSSSGIFRLKIMLYLW
jgi:hypothetical protein